MFSIRGRNIVAIILYFRHLIAIIDPAIEKTFWQIDHLKWCRILSFGLNIISEAFVNQSTYKFSSVRFEGSQAFSWGTLLRKKMLVFLVENTAQMALYSSRLWNDYILPIAQQSRQQDEKLVLIEYATFSASCRLSTTDFSKFKQVLANKGTLMTPWKWQMEEVLATISKEL